MRFVIIAALLALVAPALHAEEHAPGTCYQKTITVCVPKKPKKKVKKHPLVVVTPAPVPPPAPAPTVVVQVKQTTIVKNVPAVVPCNRAHAKPCEDDLREPRFGVYGALGIGVRDQYVQGNLGLQLTIPKVYLGLRLFSALDKGFGAQGLIYAYQGKRVRVHVVDPGILVTGPPFNYTNNTDVPRNLDMIFGAGVDVKLRCSLWLLVDWRVTLADPVMLARENGVLQLTGDHKGQLLRSDNVTGNSFSSSQLVVGLLWDLPTGHR